MANNFMVNVSKNFDLDSMTTKITEMYQAKGFSVRTFKMKNGIKITVEKGVGGINMLLGMGQGITATCMLSGKEKDTLSVNLSNGDWMGKIIAIVAGFFLCFVPIVTGVVGIVRQTNLQKDIENDLQMAINEDE